MSDRRFQILAADGTIADGAEVPALTSEEMLHLYRMMVLNRRIDERMFRLQRQGRIGFFVGSTGEEASIIGSAYALADKDWIVLVTKAGQS